jgi:putative flippase GtrA
MTVPSFLRYAAAMVMNYPLSILAMFLLVNVAGLSIPIASPLATVILMGWNYFASRWAIFAKARAPANVETDDS